MAIIKARPSYIPVDPSFRPLPRYGHYSAPMDPAWAAAKPAFDAQREYQLQNPEVDFAALRGLMGDPDAAIPPGGPDRATQVVTQILQFPARDGAMVEVKVYKSPNVVQGGQAVLMYRMHGGGFVLGGHESDGAENVYAAALHTNIVVVSVLYRKAPEHPFPKGLDDSLDGLMWCKENAATLGINPEKIILIGTSAGGNLAAVLALEARNRGISGIIGQVLHFSMLCHPKLYPTDKYELGSYVQNWDTSIVGATSIELVLEAYLGTADPEPDWRHSPLLADSFEGLPPTLIQLGGLDVLRDEGFAYAEALKSAGVDVEVYCYTGLPHCFNSLVFPPPADTAVYYERYSSWLSRVTR
ncbi:alpha/beta hydrolase fold-domain-containing protein [Microdochium bolleyi]|uniref:Alpha/beta hydrolase fold-domain-containing protein n=1 Tax=Microdochium bolleyi TaxID=196109 RepID=A0A136IZ16_9PEZI|nr:alpha/beta hydrolase fold-domain-containing protein [Microdochium bolleyi]